MTKSTSEREEPTITALSLVRPRILQFEYHRALNRTSALIETTRFTDWFDVPGYVSRPNFVNLVWPTLHRMWEDLG